MLDQGALESDSIVRPVLLAGTVAQLLKSCTVMQE